MDIRGIRRTALVGQGREAMIKCECMVCDCKWEYDRDDEEAEGLIRASCSPCGHQGCFFVENTRTGKSDKMGVKPK